MIAPMNSYQQLYQYRKSISTKPFAARGKQVIRCQRCLVAEKNCLCQYKQLSDNQTGFVLLLSDKEVLKPSNTGKLIADVMPNTFAFLWHRTEVDPILLTLLTDTKWQPILVFPKTYALTEQAELPLNISSQDKQSDKQPLFILLDGSWREARRMYRKSTYLHHLPICSLDDLTSSDDNETFTSSRYQLRAAANTEQLATAEVAAKILNMVNQPVSAKHLNLWFDVFIYQYQKSVCQTNTGNAQALAQYQDFIAKHY